MSRHTLFICIGGTGTQVGTAIGNMYPLLKSSGIAKEGDVYDMFIMDKDVLGENFRYCVKAHDDYKQVSKLLPFESLPPYELYGGLYKELQDKRSEPSLDCTVMKLIGDDPLIKELADMCWKEEKRNESLSDGNNRDPSRGAVDAHVSLKYLKETSLVKKLKELVSDNASMENIRLVVIAGITGGMGASLIVPFVEEIKTTFSNDKDLQKIGKVRIDLILLGPYFKIPDNPEKKEIDDIGTSADSYHRAKDQIKELREFVSKDSYKDIKWHIYYVDSPEELDNICGTFKKNGAVKRLSHVLELMAAVAALVWYNQEDAGYYYTDLMTKSDEKIAIDWDRLEAGVYIKPHALNLMKLIAIVATEVYPRFSQELKDLKNDAFVKMYIKKIDENMRLVDEIKAKIKNWLIHAISYFKFWNEVRLYSKFGETREVSIDFFDEESMKDLTRIFERVIDDPFTSWEKEPLNQIPLCQNTWMNYLSAVKLDRKKISDLFSVKDNSYPLLSLMINDIYKVLEKEN